jgi:photosystem II stability/assembly factor-like uncharacterized protein
LKKIIEELGLLIAFLGPYPFWVKTLFAVWVLVSCALLISFALGRPTVSERKVSPLGWQRYDVSVKQGGHHVVLRASWTDMGWLESDGWLSGAIEAGGGGGDVGRGLLLRTRDGGNSWREIDKANFDSGKGSFTWVREGGYEYKWSEVGPINSLIPYNRHLGAGQYRTELWIAAATGIYASADGGETWKRRTPPPNHPERYALFLRILSVEAFSQIYAVGWQGISHWPNGTGEWELQFPTYCSAIMGIDLGPAREVWATGHAPNPNCDRLQGGAIYRLISERARWTVEEQNMFAKDEFLSDIRVLDHRTVIVVGERGLVVRGVRQQDETFKWSRQESGTVRGLRSIGISDGVIWVVGDAGTILFSSDNGQTWNSAPPLLDDNKQPFSLQRIKFFGPIGWILANGAVFRSVPIVSK